jgi:hypothetical protein
MWRLHPYTQQWVQYKTPTYSLLDAGMLFSTMFVDDGIGVLVLAFG